MFTIFVISGEVGKWIAFVAVVLRLFFPKHFPGIEKSHISLFSLAASSSFLHICIVWKQLYKRMFNLYYHLSHSHRLAWAAWFSDPSAGSCSKLPCSPCTRNMVRLFHQPFHRMLPSSRTHPSLGWVQELVHAAPRCVKHFRDRPSFGLPCLDSYRSCLVISLS